MLESGIGLSHPWGFCHWQVRPYIKRFRTLDLDQNGRLGENDLHLALAQPELSSKLDPHALRQIKTLSAPTRGKLYLSAGTRSRISGDTADVGVDIS